MPSSFLFVSGTNFFAQWGLIESLESRAVNNGTVKAWQELGIKECVHEKESRCNYFFWSQCTGRLWLTANARSFRSFCTKNRIGLCKDSATPSLLWRRAGLGLNWILWVEYMRKCASLKNTGYAESSRCGEFTSILWIKKHLDSVFRERKKHRAAAEIPVAACVCGGFGDCQAFQRTWIQSGRGGWNPSECERMKLSVRLAVTLWRHRFCKLCKRH